MYGEIQWSCKRNYIKEKKLRVKGHCLENRILSLVFIISLIRLTLSHMYLRCLQRGETPSSARIHDTRQDENTARVIHYKTSAP